MSTFSLRFIVGLLGSMIFAISAQPAKAGNPIFSTWLKVTTPIGTGTEGGDQPFGNSFDLEYVNISGAAISGPIMVKTTLPVGFSYDSTQGNSFAACSAPINPREVICVDSVASMSNGTTRFARFYFDVATTAVTGAQVFNATVETATFPVPMPVLCQAGFGGQTQCAQDTSDVLASSLNVSALTVFSDDIFTAGTDETVRLTVNNIGYNQGNGTITLKIYWPVGVSFLSNSSGVVVWSCSGANPTSCTTNDLINGTTIFQALVRVATSIPVPGPVTVRTEIGNLSPQPLPTDCLTNPSQVGCFSTGVNTASAPAPILNITSMSHANVVMPIQANAGSITVNYSNTGNIESGNFSVTLQLPPGFTYHSLTPGALSALTACSATGTATSGQTVKCNRSAGLPLNGTGSGVIRVNIENGYISRLDLDSPLVVAAIATAAADTLNPNRIVECALTPETNDCEHHEIPVIGGCMAYVEDIYCNGYE